jgi:hypothetical protein
MPGDFVGNVSVAAEKLNWAHQGTASGFTHADFTEVESSATLTYAGKISFSAFLDHSDDPLVITKGPGNLSETLFGGLELQVEPASAWTIKAFYGAQKGGIRCAGGQCRLLPGFDGARLGVVGTF